MSPHQVGDLGIARVLEGSCDLAETVVGTPYYMSPELFSNKPYNHKSDIWALGCCVYEMATLRPPFSAHNINSLMVKIMRGQVSVCVGGRETCHMHTADSSAASAVQQRPEWPCGTHALSRCLEQTECPPTAQERLHTNSYKVVSRESCW